jgi:hypothetical protein
MRLLFAACTLAASGCLGFLHPVQPDATGAALMASCQELPNACREHVYIFMIHGLDPFDYANLSGVREYLHQLGFNKTYYSQVYGRSEMEPVLLQIHAEDAQARFVVIGFSMGATQARDLTHFAGDNGIHVDLLVYMGGNMLENVPADRPENTTQIINILAHGYIFNGAQFDGALNMAEEDVYHFGSPTHPKTLEVLTRELTELAASVPVLEHINLPATTALNDEPTPRATKTAQTAPADEWDFLKPVSRVRVKQDGG